GESDIAGHGDRGTEQIEQLNRCRSDLKRFTVLTPVPGERMDGSSIRHLECTAADTLDEVHRPALGAFPEQQRPPVLWANTARGSDHCCQFASALPRFLPPEWYSGPATDGAGQD